MLPAPGFSGRFSAQWLKRSPQPDVLGCLGRERPQGWSGRRSCAEDREDDVVAVVEAAAPRNLAQISAAHREQLLTMWHCGLNDYPLSTIAEAEVRGAPPGAAKQAITVRLDACQPTAG